MSIGKEQIIRKKLAKDMGYVKIMIGHAGISACMGSIRHSSRTGGIV